MTYLTLYLGPNSRGPNLPGPNLPVTKTNMLSISFHRDDGLFLQLQKKTTFLEYIKKYYLYSVFAICSYTLPV